MCIMYSLLSQVAQNKLNIVHHRCITFIITCICRAKSLLSNVLKYCTLTDPIQASLNAIDAVQLFHANCFGIRGKSDFLKEFLHQSFLVFLTF